MPLMNGYGKKAMGQNIKTEMHAGKPMKQSVAIAYAVAKKAKEKKMAQGGWVEAEPMEKDKVNPNLMENYSEEEHAPEVGYEGDDDDAMALHPAMFAMGGMVSGSEESDDMDVAARRYPANLEPSEQAEDGLHSAPMRHDAKGYSDDDDMRKSFLHRYMAHKALMQRKQGIISVWKNY